jgi:hypothetical protein
VILKHRDTEVLRFDWVKPFGVTNVELNRSAERFLPLAYRDRVLGKDVRTLAYETEEWLLHRTAPMRREGIGNMLCYLGFYPDDPSWRRELITFCRALSLNDVHWIAKDDSTEKWADVNLYDNPFSTAVASMAFTGEKRSSVRGASSSPEYSTNGNLRKCWRRVDGKILLYKGGAHPSDGFFEKPQAGGFEPFAEYYAAQIAEAMKLPHVDYGLAQFKHRLCSTCPLFTSDKVGFLATRGVVQKEAVLRDPRFADIFFFDAVIFNTDRHTGNFGFLVDNDANEISGIAPIFDNGYSLFSRAVSAPGKREDEFHDLRLFLDHNRPKLYRDWLGFPTGVTDEMIDRLRGLEKFEFKPHPEFVMPDKRLEVSQYFLQNRIAKIVKYGVKADRYLKIRASSVRINPLISDKMLKKAKEAEDLRKELKATLKSFPRAKTDRLAVLFKTTTRTIARHIKSLQEAGELKRIGSRKTGYWQVIEKEAEQ